MGKYKAGGRSKRMRIELRTPVAVEAWGEIWRATHLDHGAVFAVGYSTPDGRKIFRDARAGLGLWAEAGTKGYPDLARLLHVHAEEGRDPVLIVKDPGGPTLRERFEGHRAPPKEAGAMGIAVADLAGGAQGQGIGPLGISPDTIVFDPGTGSWRALPVAPGVRKRAQMLGGGRYAPPELLEAEFPGRINADSFALGWLVIESLAGDFAAPRKATRLRRYAPFPRLYAILEEAITPRADGTYVDPRDLQLALTHWLAWEADEDLAELREAGKLRQGAT